MTRHMLRLSLLLTCALPTGVAAQTSEPAGSEPGDVVVIATGQSKASSASKAETPLIESPQTISVVSREEMDLRAVTTISEALAYTAGVRGEASGIDSRTDEITVRGFSAGGFSSNNNFVDGLRLPSGGQFTRTQFDAFALQQIEVLKGPSGVLYGQSAPGGIINMVSKRPSFASHGELLLQGAGYTDLDRWQFTGGVDLSGPLNDAGTLAARIVGLARGGPTQVQHTNNERYYVSPSITFQPSEALSWTLLAQYQRDQGGATYQFLPRTGTLDAVNGERLAIDDYIGEPGWNTFDRNQILLGSFLRAELTPGLTFRSNVRYTHIDTLYRVNVLAGDALTAAQCTAAAAARPSWYAGCIPGRTVPRRAIQGDGFSDGIALDQQLAGTFNTGPLRHDLLGGVDFFYTDWEHRRDLVTPTGLPASLRGQVEPLIDQFNPVYRGSAYYASSLAPQGYLGTKSDQVGVYLQDQIAWGGLRVSLALRQDWAHDKLRNFTNPAAITYQRTNSDALTGRAGLIYLFDNGLAPYVSYAESFAPQGGDSATNVTGQPFVPTTGDQWEAGLRYEPRGGRAYLTLGAYRITQQNILTAAANNTCVAITGCQTQTGEAVIRGVEFEARAQTRVGLTLVGSATRNWSEVTKTSVAAQLGKDFPQVPDWLLSGFLDYRLPETVLPGLGFGGGVRYTGAIYGDAANTIRIPDYTLFDAFIRYDLGGAIARGRGMSLSVNAKNLANKTYLSLCGGPQSCYYGSGRTVTARLQYRW